MDWLAENAVAFVRCAVKTCFSAHKAKVTELCLAETRQSLEIDRAKLYKHRRV